MSAGDPLGLSGTVLHEQFRVGELSDSSRRSYVYKGSQVALGTPVALKFLRIPEAFASEAFLKRFRHETRLHYALAQASPNVVRVLAGGTAVLPSTGARVPFSVLEWLQGRTLASDFAERRAHWGKGRSIEEAIALLDPAVQALSTAHRQGVVHREVSPANLFLCEASDGPKLKVLDFALAKASSNALPVEAGGAKTVDLGPLASPIYAAPEQFSREAGEVGPQTDLYSLMMIFLEALRDRAVMDDSNLPLAIRVLDKQKRPTPKSLGIDVGENLELAVTEAVALRSKDRPKDIADFWDHLKKAALKDARALAISAPPRLHARSDGGEDDETEVQINVSFLRHSQAPTVPHPEPETLSRPDIDEEPLSTSGELFAMQIPPTKRSERPPPPAPPQREKTLVSPGQISPSQISPGQISPSQISPGQPPAPKFHPNATLPTMVSAQPKPPPAVTFASDPQASSAAPFQLKNTMDPPATPVMPLAPAAFEPPGAPIWVSAPRPASVVEQPPPPRPVPWLMMLIVFFVAVIALAIVAIVLLR